MIVHFTPEAGILSETLFGRVVSDEELAHAVGALEGAKLDVRVSKGDQLLVEVSHPWIERQERVCRRDAQGVLYIWNIFCNYSAIW